MKIWSKLFLVLATGMMMFSSCLESIEPEGLNDLRGAKADLLRAQTALVEAQAAQANAQAAIAQAEAKIKEAIAKQEEAKVAIIEAEALLAQYQAEYQALVNAAYEAEKAFELEQAIAAAEAAKAAAELEAQKAAALLEVELLNIQTQLLNAQAAYEVAIKNLAAAKVTLTPAQLAYLEPFAAVVMFAELAVEELTEELETAAADLAEAIATVEEQKADKFAIRFAEKAVIRAEAALAGAEEAAAIAEAALELDPKVTDWVAEKAELLAELDAMDKAKKEAMLEDEDAAAELEAKYQELKAAYEEYSDATGYSFNENTGEFGIVPGYKTALTAPEIYIPSPKNEDGYNLFYDHNDIHVAAPNFEYGDADAYGMITRFDDEIESYSTINNEYYDNQIESAEAIITGIEKQNADLYEAYETAVAAYKAGDPVAYMKYINEEFDIETPVTEYNAALKAFVAALDAWNAAQKKYAYPDKQEEADAALAVYNEAERAAYADYMKARQAAYDAYNAESVKWQNAQLAYTRAKRTYDAVLGAAVTTVGALENYPVATTADAVAADLTAAIKAYTDAKAAFVATEAVPKFDADGKWATAVATYEAELKKVNAAQKAFDDTADLTNKTDAQSVYDAAKEAYDKAEPAMAKAYADAYDAYDKIQSAAWQTYQDILADLGVAATGMDDQYETYLRTEYTNARTALETAIGNLTYIKKYVRTEVVMGDEDYTPYETTWPDFLVDEETKSLKEITVKDVVDNEHFLATTVTNLAGQIVASGAYYFFYSDVDGVYNYAYNYVVIGAPETYPLELPTYDSYTEAYPEDIWDHIYDLYTDAKDKIVENGGTILSESWGILSDMTPLEKVFEQMSYIAELEESKNDIEAAEAHIEVLEAAKADFEAYVAAEEERIDALRTKVEAEWTENAEAIKAMKDAEIAYVAEMNEIRRVVNHITIMIETYIGTADYDTFVADLAAAYAEALEAVDQAEFDLEIANDLLERVMTGDVESVEIAQAAYDKVAAELAEALAELDAAAEALDAAMVAVGAAEPAETPAE